MKKTVLFALTALACSACDWDNVDEDNTQYDGIVAEMLAIQSQALSSPGGRWRVLNDSCYNEITRNPDWTVVSTPGGSRGVYYRELPNTNVKGDIHPIQTAQVVVNYVGKLGSETVFDQGRGAKFTVNGVVTGFSTALQDMVAGDKWEICIPYALGYGTAGSSSIPGYSTLFFEIELLEIIQYP
ncbi:hypothetical protein AGMMS49982_17230 [Bacteroidia bacterium]|nr:hypothetical protein AGMMS49982_17230 [Bacteroidia bacterium]